MFHVKHKVILIEEIDQMGRYEYKYSGYGQQTLSGQVSVYVAGRKQTVLYVVECSIRGALCVRVLFSHFAEWHTTQRMYGRASIKNSAASVPIMFNYEDMRGYFQSTLCGASEAPQGDATGSGRLSHFEYCEEKEDVADNNEVVWAVDNYQYYYGWGGMVVAAGGGGMRPRSSFTLELINLITFY